ncbi:S49 family peptidase [Siphonobacter sp. SORGH_AS_0500]|uniref:S49 family peptidase n=1 Tax=Siphonobacter sp. SORGH_AS_0500 TaxID=1864824 RepID=UPI002862B3AA|nr:S49 family peptidase [Siphonobacter sp. SORGH_AS_0500]MDR6195918.1 ClpP class serine protease [Siphonobacter sp. SORGH_AS_0500]
MNLLSFSGPTSILAIEEAYFTNILFPQLSQGGALSKAYEVPTLAGIKAGPDYTMAYLDYYRVPNEQGVVVLPLKGAMSRNSSWYNAYGNAFLTALIQRAAKEASIKGIVIDAFTPGGTVDSTAALADAIYKFPKPIVGQSAFVASAGVWALAGCDLMLLEKQSTTEMGSIGTLCFHTDLRKKAEQAGEQITIFRAKGSPDKLKQNAYEELQEDTIIEIQQRLDASQKEFVAAVRRGRGSKVTSNEVFTGKMYSAADAIRLGLADGYGTLADAVQRVLDLSK